MGATRRTRWRFPAFFRVGVVGDSMLPTYRDGDWLLVSGCVPARIGDVVVSADPRLPDRLLVKRVIGRTDEGWALVGDNRARSTDTRHFGPVPDAMIRGRVLLRLGLGLRRRV